MTLRIQKTCDCHGTIMRLSGRLAAEHRGDLSEQIESSVERPALDLEEVTLVDLEGVMVSSKMELTVSGSPCAAKTCA